MTQNADVKMCSIAAPEAMLPASGLNNATHCSVNA